MHIDAPHVGTSISLEAPEGATFYTLAKENQWLGEHLECACGGIAACSTCHIIVLDEQQFSCLAPPEEAEQDMLDLAEGVTPTSRLGCQVRLDRHADGLKVKLPASFVNLF